MTPTIIGAGRVGIALSELAGTPAHQRGQAWHDAPPGPLIVCTRNDDLAAVIQATPAHRREDLVFIQNGMLRPLLVEHGLQDNTQALVYFAVSKRGDAPVDGGGTVVTGKWAQAFCKLLAKGDLECSVVDSTRFGQQMVEKLLWNCVFGLLCQVHDASVGTLVREQRAQIDALVAELSGVAERALGLTLESGVSQRLCDYSLKIADYKGAVKEMRWRNGWFLEQERTPVHVGLLERALVL